MADNCSKKLIVIGDPTCGKTSLLIVFTQDRFPEAYIPTVFETHATDIEVDGAKVYQYTTRAVIAVFFD